MFSQSEKAEDRSKIKLKVRLGQSGLHERLMKQLEIRKVDEMGK